MYKTHDIEQNLYAGMPLRHQHELASVIAALYGVPWQTISTNFPYAAGGHIPDWEKLDRDIQFALSTPSGIAPADWKWLLTLPLLSALNKDELAAIAANVNDLIGEQGSTWGAATFGATQASLDVPAYVHIEAAVKWLKTRLGQPDACWPDRAQPRGKE